jgi:hypothetical protein
MVIEILEARRLMSVSAYPTAVFDAVGNGVSSGGTGTSADRCDPYTSEWNYDTAGRVPDQSGGQAASSTVVTDSDSGDGNISSTCRK